MAWSLRQPKPEVISQCENRTEIELSQALGGYTDEIIDVPRCTIFATYAVAEARAGHSGVVGAWEWWNSGSVQVHDGPDDSLRGK